MIDINDPNLYKLCRKKHYNIKCCIPPKDIEIYNHLEDAHYITNDTEKVIMKGLMNEIWLIDLPTLMRSYRFIDGTPINLETLNERGKIIDNDLIMNWQEVSSIKSNSLKFAQRIPKIYKLKIRTKYGTLLNVNSENSVSNHFFGDFILCSTNPDGTPNLNDKWVVDGNIFDKTYEFVK